MTPRATGVLVSTSASASAMLLHGSVIDRRPHSRGTLLLLPPDAIAFYCLRSTRCRTFVFRTLAAPEPLCTELPGVEPAVRLLLDVDTRGRLTRMEELLRFLQRKGVAPSKLSDRFYLRLHAILRGKLPRSGKVLRSLLDDEAGGRW